MRIFRGVGAPAMKGVLLLFVVLAGLSATGQELSVSVWKHADADFGRYKSFDWAAHLDHVLDEHHFFLDDLVLKADVRFAIRNELQERGYELNRFARIFSSTRECSSDRALQTPSTDTMLATGRIRNIILSVRNQELVLKLAR